MVFRHELLNHLSTDEHCDLEFGVLEQLAQDGEVMVYQHSGLWECLDHERDLMHLNDLWSASKAFWKIW